MKFKAGDKVRITPTETICPWKGKPVGVIASVEDDGTVAVEVESKEMFGHCCSLGSAHTKNGWWFMLEELELIGE